MEVVCEECGQTSSFPATQQGSLQDCPHCGASVDVGEAAFEGWDEVPGEDEDIGSDPADEDVVLQIKDLIETRVRPAVANDGGDIVYRGFRQGVVYLTMQGACSGCPSSAATLKQGIEGLLKHYVPEVIEVRAA